MSLLLEGGLGSCGEDGAGAEPNGTGIWEVTCQHGLCHKGERENRSLIHLSPLLSRARSREEYRVAHRFLILTLLPSKDAVSEPPSAI